MDPASEPFDFFPAPPTSRRELQRRALRRGSDFFARVQERRRSLILSGRTVAPRRLVRAYEIVQRELAGTRPLASDDFVQAQGGTTSQLLAPAILRLPLAGGVHASALLARMFDDARVRQLVADARFSPGDLAYRVDDDQGRPRIGGEDGSTLGHLSCIGHELGHCVHEEAHRLEGYASVVEGEAYAQLVQSLVVTEQLTAHGEDALAIWRAYEERVDLVGAHFFALYLADATGAPAAALFEPRFRVFHPAYFHLPGFECVFALGGCYRRMMMRRLDGADSVRDVVTRIRAGHLLDEGAREELASLFRSSAKEVTP